MRDFQKPGDQISFTNGSTAVAANTLISVGNFVGVTVSDVPANSVGELQITGQVTVKKDNGNMANVGATVYLNGDSATLTGAPNRKLVGSTVTVAGTSATTVEVILGYPSILGPAS